MQISLKRYKIIFGSTAMQNPCLWFAWCYKYPHWKDAAASAPFRSRTRKYKSSTSGLKKPQWLPLTVHWLYYKVVQM